MCRFFCPLNASLKAYTLFEENKKNKLSSKSPLYSAHYIYSCS